MSNLKSVITVEQTLLGKLNMFIAVSLAYLGLVGTGRTMNKLLCNKVNFKYKYKESNKWHKLDMSDRCIEIVKE